MRNRKAMTQSVFARHRTGNNALSLRTKRLEMYREKPRHYFLMIRSGVMRQYLRPSRVFSILVCVSSVVISCAALGARPAPGGFELVANGDIEAIGKAGKPVGWSTASFKGGKGKFSVDTTVAHSGKRSLKIEGAAGNMGHCMWRCAYVPIDVTEATEVDLSVWIKAEDSPWLMVRVVTWDANKKFLDYLTPFGIELGGFFDWKEFKKTIKLKPGGRRLTVYLVQPRAGTVWFDDIKLVAKKDIRVRPGRKPKVKPRPAPKRPRVPKTAATDMFEFRNYIRNTRAVGPAGEDGLPFGWSVHNPPQEETIGKVVWAKDDPRPGFHGLCVIWQGGGRYIAAQPELIKPVTGERPLKFQAYVKTTGEGKAYLIAQCINRAGKLIRQEKSKVIENAKDYVTCRLDFVSHPDTANLRLYCVNGGTGKVWFHWVILEPIMDAVKKMAQFPYTVSAEPAEGNRFWNNGEAVLHSFEDSPVSLSFAFWGDKSRLDEPELHVSVPAGLTIAEAFNMEPRKPVSHAKAEFTTEKITRDGAPYVRHVFPGPAALRRLRVTPYLLNHMTTCFIPKAGEKKREFKIYYRAENGGVRSVEKHFTLRILPPMKKTPNPKRFISHLWTVDDINFYDMGLVEKAVRRFEEAALAGRERFTAGREEIHRVDQFLKKRGWFLFFETGDYGFRLSKVRGIGADGKPAKSSRYYCPTNAVTDMDFYEKVLVEDVRKYVETSRIEDGEYVFLDYEPGSIATKYCFCERCRKNFAKKFNIPLEKVQTRRDILMSYSKEWGQYWVWLSDNIIRLHVEAYKRANPSLKHLLYCYPIWFNDPKALQTKLFNSPLDTRLNQKHMDRLGLSFYHIYGKTAFDLLDVNTRVLKKPCFTMPLMGTTTGYWGNFTDDEILSPAGMRQQVLIAATSGAAGVMPYQGKLMDGMCFLKIDQAMSEIAALEDFYMDGERVDTMVSFQGLTSLQGRKPPKKLLTSGWADYTGIRAHRLGGSILVTVFNFRRDKDSVLKLRFSGLKQGNWRVVDAISKRPLGPARGDPSFTAARLAQGITCHIAAEDVIFVLLTRR